MLSKMRPRKLPFAMLNSCRIWRPFRFCAPPLIRHTTPPPLGSVQAQAPFLIPPATMSTLSSSSPIKTRFLVISDTHNASPVQNATSADTAFRPPLPKADVLLHCGDLTMVGRYSEYEATLEMLASIDADLKLVIAGNHDISLDEAYYRRKGQSMQRLNQADESLPARARELWTGELAKAAGVTFLDEGTYSFVLKNGAKLRVCFFSSHIRPFRLILHLYAFFFASTCIQPLRQTYQCHSEIHS